MPDMVDLGSFMGRRYWLNRFDLYVYPQHADGAIGRWVCHYVLWDYWRRCQLEDPS